MDKKTLGNYGWVVVVVIILSMMIALASPFALAIKNAFVGTVNNFGGHLNEALDVIENGDSGNGDTNENISPGLYRTGSNYTEPVESLNDLVTSGVISITNGVLSTNLDVETWENSSSEALAGDLVLPNDGSIKKLGNAYWDDEEYIYVGDVAFAYCTNLTSIVIPDSVTTISSGAFEGCTNLTSVNIPASVTDIGEYIFFDCIKINSVKIAKGIDSFDLNLFRGCDELVTIVFTGTMEECNKVLSGMAWNTRIHTVYIQCSDGQIVFEYMEPV